MRKLFVASSNRHKLEEFKAILELNGLSDVQIVSPADYDIEGEPDENGSTFKENAYIKASFYHERLHIPVIADDSGICIDYLDGKPGIHSARFLPEMTYPEKCVYITDIMKGVKKRGAQFVDCLCFIDRNEEINYYIGTNVGLIADEPAGDKGFGYDPIFLIPEYNMTEAQLGEEYKNVYSHRAKALQKWIIDANDKL